MELANWFDFFTAVYGLDPFGTGQTARERWAADPIDAGHRHKDPAKAMRDAIGKRRRQYRDEAENNRPRWVSPEPRVMPNDPKYDAYCRDLAAQRLTLETEAQLRKFDALYGSDPFGTGQTVRQRWEVDFPKEKVPAKPSIYRLDRTTNRVIEYDDTDPERVRNWPQEKERLRVHQVFSRLHLEAGGIAWSAN